MGIFTPEEHRAALIRRRIKFVVEKGAMARLFRAGTHRALQDELYRRIVPAKLARINTRDEYDKWLFDTIEASCWECHSRNGIEKDRWGYFVKLVNIVVYEVLANRELFSDTDWKRLRPFLHIPIDKTITSHLSGIAPAFPAVDVLKRMTKAQYVRVQEAVRQLGDQHGVPPIWFEAAWAAIER